MRTIVAIVQRGSQIGVAVFIVVMVGLAPNVCSAVPPVESAASEPVVPPVGTRRWYGWQTFAADGVASAFFLTAVADDYNATLFGFSGVTFALATPTIHATHGNWEVALASVGMRVLLPLMGAIVGGSSDVHVTEDATGGAYSSSKWASVGAGVGGLIASLADGLLLAYDTRLPPPPVAPRNQLLRAHPMPQLTLLSHGIGLRYSQPF